MKGHQQFLVIPLDRDKLRRRKHHCVQADDTDRLICNRTFSDQVMGLDLRSTFQRDLLGSNHNYFDASRQEEHHVGKINVVPLLNQMSLPKNVSRKTAIFNVCSLEAKPLT